ncbi:unnamed protein product [Strongylus vulgaris]|uniref:SAC3/GANP/THP3 conserved domain-containing protein n=1 Tax=Strongylus vulgaris TaxID=40348 RepID=A0A3P7JP04_STRVU|nr:unnamed protein product [Strongylus vulgaris]
MLISGTVASRVQGMCKTMCPDAEIRFRCSNGMIHPLEKCEVGRRNRKFVKEYARPAAGRDHLHPECLRPPDILIETVRYLMEVYEEEKNIRFACVYAFMCDRLRAVRQDMILQVVLPVDTVRILQEMIPFYFESDYLCRTKGCSSYDWKLHLTSLEECLSRWKEALPYVPKELICPRTLSTLCIAYKSTQMRVPISAMTQWLYYPDTCDLIALLSCCSVAQADSILVSSINLNALESEESKKAMEAVVMISDIAWIPRGVAKKNPDKVKLDEEQLKKLISGGLLNTYLFSDNLFSHFICCKGLDTISQI